MMETLTVFEDVKVPWDRVFLKGEVDVAGPLAKTFVEFHRFTAVSYKLPLVDLFVGAAHLMADYNGVLSAGHVRDKLAKLISYAQICRGMTREAARESKVTERHRGPQRGAHQHRQAPLRHRLPPGAGVGAGHRRRPPGHRAQRGGPRRAPAARARSTATSGPPGAGRGSAAADEPHRRDHRQRLRGLPGGARGARRGEHRGGEDDHLAAARHRAEHPLRQSASPASTDAAAAPADPTDPTGIV